MKLNLLLKYEKAGYEAGLFDLSGESTKPCGVARIDFTARNERTRFYNDPSKLARSFFRDGG